MGKRDMYPELCGKIREKCRTQGNLARKVGMNPSTLSAKLAGKSQWSFLDVAMICKALDIPMADAHIFFTPNVATLQRCAVN